MQNPLSLENLDINPKYLEGHFVTPGQDWGIRNAVLPFNKLYFVQEGRLIVEMDKKTYVLHRGDMIVIPRAKKHSMRTGGKQPLQKFFFHFTSLLTNSIDVCELPELSQGNPVVSFQKNYDEIEAEFLRMYTQDAHKNRMPELMRLTASFLYILSIYIEKRLEALQKPGNDAYAAVIRYMSENLASGITLRECANRIHLSPEHFIRSFKALYGISPMRYYDRLRAEHAAETLRETDISISDIAAEIGISDSGYFSNFFKRHMGISPLNYRKMRHLQNIRYLFLDTPPKE